MSYEKNAALPSVKVLLEKHIPSYSIMCFDNETYTFTDAACKLKRGLEGRATFNAPCLHVAINAGGAQKAGTSYDGWHRDILASICPDQADQEDIR